MNITRRTEIILLACAAAFTPLLVGTVRGVMTIGQTMIQSPATPIEEAKLAPLRAEATRFTGPELGILMSSVTTQVSETLLLAREWRLQKKGTAHLIALEDRPLTMTGGLTLLPQFSLEKWAAARDAGAAPTLALPSWVDGAEGPRALKFDTHRDRLNRLRARAPEVLVAGEGARLASALGWLKEKAATAYPAAAEDLEQSSPSTRWDFAKPFVEDTSGSPKLSTSAGLFFTGVSQTAEVTHRASGYRKPPAISAFEALQLFFATGFSWTQTQVAVLLYPGADEASVASFFDLLPRSFTTRVYPVALRKEPVRLASGIWALPLFDLRDAEVPDFLVIPDGAALDAETHTALAQWTDTFKKPLRDFHRTGDVNPQPVHQVFSRTLDWMMDEELGMRDRVPLIRKLTLTAHLDASSEKVSAPAPWIVPPEKLMGALASSLVGMGLVALLLSRLRKA